MDDDLLTFFRYGWHEAVLMLQRGDGRATLCEPIDGLSGPEWVRACIMSYDVTAGFEACLYRLGSLKKGWLV